MLTILGAAHAPTIGVFDAMDLWMMLVFPCGVAALPPTLHSHLSAGGVSAVWAVEWSGPPAVVVGAAAGGARRVSEHRDK
jgi:hypothetical protein